MIKQKLKRKLGSRPKGPEGDKSGALPATGNKFTATKVSEHGVWAIRSIAGRSQGNN